VILACLPVAQFFYRKAHTSMVRWLVDSRLRPKRALQRRDLPAAENDIAEMPDADMDRDLQGGVAAALDRGEPVTITMDALARCSWDP